jgi:type I restriction enzyme, S subunit
MSVPALRFKGFDGVWKNRPLSEIIGRLESGVSVNSEDSPITDFHEYGILKTSCIADGYFIEQENKKIIPIDISRAKLNPNEDTILVSRMNTPFLVGEVGYVTKSYPNLFVPDRLWLIEVKNKSRDSTKWLSQQLATKKLKSTLTNIASGTSGSMKNIAQPNFLKIELSTPGFNEQTKIANFLTAVDEKIHLLTQKHDLLTQYKKGVMQQIFSQELRFKDDDGQDFPEWEESKLGEISSFFSGGTPLTTKNDYYGGEIPFIKSGEISANKTAQFISESGLKNSSAKMVLKGDLLYALYGATSGEVAVSKIEGAVNQAVLCIRSKLDTYFLLSYFLFEKQNILQTYLQGGQGNLSAEIIKSLIVPVPSKLEQTKIANFLTAIDDKITATQTQLQAVKQYKQGLLQQMFV